MKKIILACLVLAGTCSFQMAQAQKPAQPAAQQPAGDNELLLFGSKANELDASLERGNLERAQVVLPELMTMMQSRIAKNRQAMDASKDSAVQAEISKRLKTEMTLAAEIKQLSVDMSKNRKEIVAKVKAFTEVF